MIYDLHCSIGQEVIANHGAGSLPSWPGHPAAECAEGISVWEAASVAVEAPLSSLLDPLCHSA